MAMATEYCNCYGSGNVVTAMVITKVMTIKKNGNREGNVVIVMAVAKEMS